MPRLHEHVHELASHFGRAIAAFFFFFTTNIGSVRPKF